ncbi:MAG: hypothetical protein JXR95_04420 [Deltaproteobacteria bacterium]|nr:hypothetical protein [Deltaproteobacteria bacterium]
MNRIAVFFILSFLVDPAAADEKLKCKGNCRTGGKKSFSETASVGENIKKSNKTGGLKMEEKAKPREKESSVSTGVDGDNTGVYLDGRTIRLRGSLSEGFTLPSVPYKYKVKNGRFYGACGKHGLFIINVEHVPFKKISVLDAGKEVKGFRITSDGVISITVDYNLKSYSFDGKSSAVDMIEIIRRGEGQKLNNLNPGTKIGSVVSTGRGFVVFSVSKNVALRVGDVVEVRSTHGSKINNIFSGVNQDSSNRVISCVAVVSQIKGNRAVLELGKGEYAMVGDAVFTSQRELTVSKYFPRRIPSSLSASLELIPVFGSSSSDDHSYFSAITLIDVIWRTDSPLTLKAGLSPALYLGNREYGFSSSTGFNVFGVLLYDSDYFAIGMGTGYLRPLMSQQSAHNRQGMTIVQYVRLGSIDGLNLKGEFHGVYSDDNKDNSIRAMFGMLRLELTVPLIEKTGLFFRYLGDGRTLTNFAGGLKTFLRGQGGAGSIIIPITIGYTSINPYVDETSKYKVAGSSFSVGFEYIF